jgi:hypothetical protein
MVEFTFDKPSAAGNARSRADTSVIERRHHQNFVAIQIKLWSNSKNSTSEREYQKSRTNWGIPIVRQPQPEITFPPFGLQFQRHR